MDLANPMDEEVWAAAAAAPSEDITPTTTTTTSPSFPTTPANEAAAAAHRMKKQQLVEGSDDEGARHNVAKVLTMSTVEKPKKKKRFVAPLRKKQPAPVVVVASASAEAEEKAPPALDADENSPPVVEDVVCIRRPAKKKFKALSSAPINSATKAIRPHEPLELEAGVRVPGLICQFLRPHQREGVKFLFECLAGRREYPPKVRERTPGRGAILADGMGLGKTLQTIAVVYSLLRLSEEKNKHSLSPVRRVVVACPCSLVGNWQREFEKWINERAATRAECVMVRALTDGNKTATALAIDQFLSPSRPFHVLVVSYETLRNNIERLAKAKANGCDLLVADEAQRLKGAKTLVNGALASLDCERRVLLTGTPLQNDLEEFHAMADVANPGVFGSIDRFRKRYVNPILRMREPDATPDEKELGARRQTALSTLAKCFVLRRENRLNAVHLPPKLDLVVCCRMPAAQRLAYERTLGDKQLQHALKGNQSDCLTYIDKLLKVCNHPLLLADDKESPKSFSIEADSGKMCVLYRLMREMRRRGDGERIVVVANATSSLELVANMCDKHGWPWCLLDGKTPIKRRKQLNTEFNDPATHHFAFLLSSTAGGCGLNLVGGNRLVLYDSSWNPATDKQAAARCWRDGNPRRCFTYRLVSTGTIEEKMYQRQISKEGLLGVIEDREQISAFSSEDLRRLFVLDKRTTSDTHARLDCACVAATQAAADDVVLEEEEDCSKLGPERAAACREYLVAQTVKVLATKLAPEASRLKQKVADHLEAVRDCLAAAGTSADKHDLDTIPRVRREIDKVFVEASKEHSEDPRLLSAVEKMRADLQSTWHALVPKLFAIDEETAHAPQPDHQQQQQQQQQLAPPKLACKPQVGMPTEEDLNNWSHHASVGTVDDEVLISALKGKYDKFVSFVFTLETNAELIKQAEADKQRLDEAAKDDDDDEEEEADSSP